MKISGKEAGTLSLIHTIKDLGYTYDEMVSVAVTLAQHLIGDDRSVLEYFVELKEKAN